MKSSWLRPPKRRRDSFPEEKTARSPAWGASSRSGESASEDGVGGSGGSESDVGLQVDGTGGRCGSPSRCRWGLGCEIGRRRLCAHGDGVLADNRAAATRCCFPTVLVGAATRDHLGWRHRHHGAETRRRRADDQRRGGQAADSPSTTHHFNITTRGIGSSTGTCDDAAGAASCSREARNARERGVGEGPVVEAGRLFCRNDCCWA